jgi:hypothetical protein
MTSPADKPIFSSKFAPHVDAVAIGSIVSNTVARRHAAGVPSPLRPSVIKTNSGTVVAYWLE